MHVSVTPVTEDQVVLSVQPDGEQIVITATNAHGGRRAAAKNFRAVKQNGDVYVFPIHPTFISIAARPGAVQRLEARPAGLRRSQRFVDPADRRLPARPPSERPRTPGRADAALAGGCSDACQAHADEFGRALERQLKVDVAAIRTGKLNRLARSGLFAGVEKIYLDEKVKAALADSVPQIGAPWCVAGLDGIGVDVAVLDTGIDATHADLQGKIAAQATFTDEALDRRRQRARNARRLHRRRRRAGIRWVTQGVAPGADLMIGKVLNSFGSGLDSWVMAGMDGPPRTVPT